MVVHSQDDRASRLKYLVAEFKKRRTFLQVGISDTHASLLHLLMLLSTNPVGSGGTIHDYEPIEFGIGGVHDNLPE